MLTLSDIRTQFYALIDQSPTNSKFTPTQANELINQAIRYIAVRTTWPRKMYSVQAVEDQENYTLPTDNMLILNAWFGNVSVRRDVRPIDLLTVETLDEINPFWMDETSDTQGRPTRVILRERTVAIIDPRPNAEESATGKKLHLQYIYEPATLSSDSANPDIGTAFHDHIHVYAAHLAYLGKLANPKMANDLLKLVNVKVDEIKPVTTKDVERMGWVFSSDDAWAVGGDDGFGVSDLTL